MELVKTLSFNQVFEHLFKKNEREIFILPLSQDFIDNFWDLISEDFLIDVELKIPDFTSASVISGEKVSFSATTFNLKILSVDKIQEDYCEGKSYYSHNITVQDLNTQEKFILSISYLNDSITDVAIHTVKTKKKKS